MGSLFENIKSMSKYLLFICMSKYLFNKAFSYISGDLKFYKGFVGIGQLYCLKYSKYAIFLMHRFINKTLICTKAFSS